LSSVLRPRQHSIGYMGDDFLQVKRPKQQYQSTEGKSYKRKSRKIKHIANHNGQLRPMAHDPSSPSKLLVPEILPVTLHICHAYWYQICLVPETWTENMDRVPWAKQDHCYVYYRIVPLHMRGLTAKNPNPVVRRSRQMAAY